jgi:hypothetical protein
MHNILSSVSRGSLIQPLLPGLLTDFMGGTLFFTIPLPQENAEKIKVFKVLPYLVSNVIEVRDVTYLCRLACACLV